MMVFNPDPRHAHQVQTREIDPDTPDDRGFWQPLFDVMAGLTITIGKLGDELRKTRYQEQQRLARLPNFMENQQASVLAAGGADLKDFGGPPPGREWVVRLLAAVANP